MGRPAMRPRRKMLPPYAECWRDRHGKVRTYFRKGISPRAAAVGLARVRSGLPCRAHGTPLPARRLRSRRLEHRRADRELSATRRRPHRRSAGRRLRQAMLPARDAAARARSPVGRGPDAREHQEAARAFADKPGAALSRLKMLRVRSAMPSRRAGFSTIRRSASSARKCGEIARGPTPSLRGSRRAGRRIEERLAFALCSTPGSGAPMSSA